MSKSLFNRTVLSNWLCIGIRQSGGNIESQDVTEITAYKQLAL